MKSPKTFLLAIGLAAGGLLISIFLLLTGGDGTSGTPANQAGRTGDAADTPFAGTNGDFPGPRPAGPDGKIYIPKKPVIDLAYVRAELPNNLYWKLSAPTRDAAVLRTRAREKARWDKLLGKIRSNTAEPEDIRIYYDYRRGVSEDYITFMKFVLKKYGSKMKEKELGLYKVGLELHMARLKQIPRDRTDALARRTAYLEKKRRWAKRQ